jgi:hypothetical protein
MTFLANPVDDLKYDLILVTSDSRKVLVENTNSRNCLPSVHIHHGTRVARELQKAIRTRWHLDVIVLDISRAGEPPCAVAEVRSPIRHTVLSAVDPSDVMEVELDERLGAQLVSVLNEKSSSGSVFSRIGWIDEAFAWLETETGRKPSSISEIEQYNAGVGFSLVRFRMDDESDYWLKATSEPNSHEFAVTCLLSELAGDYLPKVIATRQDWNAWLMSDEFAPGRELGTDPLPMLGRLPSRWPRFRSIQWSTIPSS